MHNGLNYIAMLGILSDANGTQREPAMLIVTVSLGRNERPNILEEEN